MLLWNEPRDEIREAREAEFEDAAVIETPEESGHQLELKILNEV